MENPPAAEAPSPARTAPTHHVPVPETCAAPSDGAKPLRRTSPGPAARGDCAEGHGTRAASGPRRRAVRSPPASAAAPDPSARRHPASCSRSPAARFAPTPRARRATPTPRYLGIGRLLRIASARGASSLFLTANARPSIRLDDEILPLETEPPLGKAEVEALILELAPGASREAFAGGTSAEWVYELPDVGRVRCVSFRDQRGPGAVFRLIPTRLISADQLGLSRDIQALCSEREGW